MCLGEGLIFLVFVTSLVSHATLTFRYIYALYVECWFLGKSCKIIAADIGRRRSHYETARMLLYANPFVKPLPSH